MKLRIRFILAGLGLIAIGVTLYFITNKGIPSPPAAPRHASWMEENLQTLGHRKLSQLVLPASHDAAMYRANFLGWGQTQCASIYDQLEDGIRWFDLRPEWTGKKFRIHHGSVAGPDFSEVLEDVKKFAQEGHRELILLKLSHYAGLDPESYAQLAANITNTLGPWLAKPPLHGTRLANRTLSEYVQTGPKVLVLVDKDYTIRHPVPGLWVYADWNARDAAQADLRVYDNYSNTNDFAGMAADQFRKFDQFDGKCADKKTDCDLFLLSWTITPGIKIWSASQPALKNLENSLAGHPAMNPQGKIMNLIYVDFCEFAHATDTAIQQNQRLTSTLPNHR